MLVEQVDHLCFEPLQRSLSNFLDVLWTAVQPSLLGIFDVESELRRDHNILAKGRQRFADKFFIPERAIDFSGIKECHATLNGSTDQGDTFSLVNGAAVALTQAHTAESNRRDFEIAWPKFPFCDGHCACCHIFM